MKFKYHEGIYCNDESLNYCENYPNCDNPNKFVCKYVVCKICYNITKGYRFAHLGDCTHCDGNLLWLAPCCMNDTIYKDIIDLLSSRDDIRVIIEMMGEYTYEG